jgi:hypothetical protein
MEAIDAYRESFRCGSPDVAHHLARAFVEGAVFESARLADPLIGLGAIEDHVHRIRQALVGYEVVRPEGPQRSGRLVRWTWVIRSADGEPISEGMDVAVLGDGGRMESLTVFDGRLPPAGPSGDVGPDHT